MPRRRGTPAWSEPKATRMDAESTERAGGARGVSRYDPRRMALHPHTPVVVGVGQVTIPPDPRTDPAERPEPVELMARALRAAAEDATGAAPGGPAAAGNALIRRADSIRVVVPLAWRSVNPALLVAAKLGFDADSMPPELVLTAVGGNAPQALLHDACRAISRGDLGVVLVTGAEAMYTRAAARRDPAKPAVNWSSQPVEGTPLTHLVRDRARRGDGSRNLPRRSSCPSRPTRSSKTRCAPPTGGHWPSTGRTSARCGPASARSPHPTPTPGSPGPLAPRRSPRPRRRTA